MKLLTTFFVTLTLSLFANSGKTTYVYNKVLQGKDSQTTWTIEKKETTWHIQGDSTGGQTIVIASPTQLNTQSFNYHSKRSGNHYSIHRNGDQIKALRKTDNETFEKHFSLNGEEWVQEFDFSFKPFILSKATSFKFCIVDPKKLNLYKMIAYKQGLDQIEINGKEWVALKVTVTLRGFKKMFWQGELWFEQETGDLLKYKANEGPNTPVSIITLLSKKEE